MSRRNIYETDRSCYARREGVWVPGTGVNPSTAPAIAALILRDYLRGFTYDHECREVPMTHDLFVRRLAYLVALCRKHTGSVKAEDYVRELVDFVKIYDRLPPSIQVRLAGNPQAIAEIARELRGRATIVPLKTPAELPTPIPHTVPLPPISAVIRRRVRVAA